MRRQTRRGSAPPRAQHAWQGPCSLLLLIRPIPRAPQHRRHAFTRPPPPAPRSGWLQPPAAETSPLSAPPARPASSYLKPPASCLPPSGRWRRARSGRRLPATGRSQAPEVRAPAAVPEAGYCCGVRARTATQLPHYHRLLAAGRPARLCARASERGRQAAGNCFWRRRRCQLRRAARLLRPKAITRNCSTTRRRISAP